MRFATIFLLLCVSFTSVFSAQEGPNGPADEKAKKTYKEAMDYLRQQKTVWALEAFKKADKQDGGHCAACRQNLIKYGIQLQEWKLAEEAAQEEVAQAISDDVALAHYDLGVVFMSEAMAKHKAELFQRAHDEMAKAIAAHENFPKAVYTDGRALAHLNQDDAAKAQFERFIQLRPDENDPDHQRALRYVTHPELARARMAPPFSVTTLDGRQISLDDLQGKVVLLDFWATWCGPCREALPHMKKLAKSFEGQPLVVLSISLDRNETVWKDFIAKNGMTWPQYRDGYFEGPIARMFSVDAIPHTFTIDADGVLQDEHIGDASIEGKLKKLISHARELQPQEKAAQ
ncbi:MAG TPA: TlpA disulfide reductase family protein [Candidatus Angelobacter sp.]|nr:TlpA disulfide reductase family protein [Candidatus Angelobacter sp.]